MNIFRWLVCLFCGHKQPPVMHMRQLDKETMKPNGKGIWCCTRCGTISWTHEENTG